MRRLLAEGNSLNVESKFYRREIIEKEMEGPDKRRDNKIGPFQKVNYHTLRTTEKPPEKSGKTL
jgi:hypothetical protein